MKTLMYNYVCVLYVNLLFYPGIVALLQLCDPAGRCDRDLQGDARGRVGGG